MSTPDNEFGPFPDTPIEFQDSGLRRASHELRTGVWWELLTLREGLAQEYGIPLSGVTSTGLVYRVKKSKHTRPMFDYPGSMQIHATANTTVHVLDEPDPAAGGGCHRYAVKDASGNVLMEVWFQHGPIGEAGVNGVQHEDLLAIVQHRLDCFQRGPFASPANEVTCGFVGAAMASDATRTRRRQVAGVEGTSARAPGVED